MLNHWILKLKMSFLVAKKCPSPSYIYINNIQYSFKHEFPTLTTKYYWLVLTNVKSYFTIHPLEYQLKVPSFKLQQRTVISSSVRVYCSECMYFHDNGFKISIANFIRLTRRNGGVISFWYLFSLQIIDFLTGCAACWWWLECSGLPV